MNNKKAMIKKIAVSSALVGIIGTIGGQLATPLTAQASVNTDDVSLIHSESNESLTPLFELIETGVFNEFNFNQTGELSFSISLEEAISKYNLSFSQSSLLFNILEEIKRTDFTNETLATRMHIKGFTIYFTHSDVVMYLSSVAMVGPAGVVAAIVGAASIMGSPVAGIIAGVTSSFSAGAIYWMLMDAISNGKGFYIGAAGIGQW